MLNMRGGGFVITPANYKEYKKTELKYNDGTAVPLVYEPSKWRPPGEWYKQMDIPVSVGVLLQPLKEKKSGRPAGSAARTARFEIRCRPDLLEVLKELQAHGWSMAGLSASDIIHMLIKSAAGKDLSNGVNAELQKKIDNLDAEVPTLLERFN